MSMTDDEIAELAALPECPVCNTEYNVECEQCGNGWRFCTCVDGDIFYCLSCTTFFQWDLTTGQVYELFVHRENLRGLGRVADLEKKNSAQKEELNQPPNPTTCLCSPQKMYYCGRCKVRREKLTDPWRSEPLLKSTTVYSGGTTTSYPAGYSSGGSWSDDYGYGVWSKCRHYFQAVEFPDGTTVYASSLRKHDPDGEPGVDIPDWGLYFDWSWNPGVRAEFLDWADYGRPTHLKVAANAITDAFNRARTGLAVEVGCIGGHGRTGTALACMAILAGVNSNNATKWVHTNYCKEAVESQKQRWFIAWFDAYTHGKPLPKEPVWATSTVSSPGYYCTESGHTRMWLDGKTCEKGKDGKGCTWWEKDIKKVTEDGVIPDELKHLGDLHQERAKRAAERAKQAAQLPKRKHGEVSTSIRQKHSPNCNCDPCRYQKLGFGALIDGFAVYHQNDTHNCGYSECPGNCGIETPEPKPTKELVPVQQQFDDKGPRAFVQTVSGELIEVSVTNDFDSIHNKPTEPGGKPGERRGDWEYRENEGWVWMKLADAYEQTEKNFAALAKAEAAEKTANTVAAVTRTYYPPEEGETVGERRGNSKKRKGNKRNKRDKKNSRRNHIWM